MKADREYGDFVNDMLSSIKDTYEFTKSMNYEDFFRDRKTTHATVRSLEIFGEAAKHIPQNIRDRHTDIPWKKIIGLRNRIAHDYFGIDLKLVWKIVKEELPELKPAIQRLSKKI
jgi:uncharacterized protein with HEPN domain